jgi:hypothetical protein
MHKGAFALGVSLVFVFFLGDWTAIQV